MNIEIENMMKSIFASKYGADCNFSDKLADLRNAPIDARAMFCDFSTADCSRKSIQNQILIYKIYDSIYREKYCIDYYDVICVCMLNISFYNKDYWSAIRFCEEIIETTKDEYLRSAILKPRNIAERMSNMLNLNGYTKEALNYFTNSNDFETFWIMCKKRHSGLKVDLLSASPQNISVKLDAEGSFTGYGSLGEYSVGYSDGFIILTFSEIEEYSNKKPQIRN